MSYRSGFTLLETLIVAAIVCLTLTLGVPSFAKAIEQQRLRSTTSDLMRSLQLARSAAIVNHNYICAVKNGDSWQMGWTVFIDTNLNCALEDGERILFQHDALSSNIWIKTTTVAGHYIRYIPTGESEQLSGAYQSDSIYVCSPKNLIDGFRVVIKRGGSMRADRVTAGAEECNH